MHEHKTYLKLTSAPEERKRRTLSEVPPSQPAPSTEAEPTDDDIDFNDPELLGFDEETPSPRTSKSPTPIPEDSPGPCPCPCPRPTPSPLVEPTSDPIDPPAPEKTPPAPSTPIDPQLLNKSGVSTPPGAPVQADAPEMTRIASDIGEAETLADQGSKSVGKIYSEGCSEQLLQELRALGSRD